MEVDVGEFGNAPELLQPKHEGQSRIKDKGLSALYLGTCFSAGLTMSPDPYWSTKKTGTHIPYKTHLYNRKRADHRIGSFSTLDSSLYVEQSSMKQQSFTQRLLALKTSSSRNASFKDELVQNEICFALEYFALECFAQSLLR